MKFIIAALLVIFIFLQYKIWIDKQGAPHIVRLKEDVQRLTDQNTQLEKQNQILQKKVDSYKKNVSGYEDRAREELGLVKKNEIFIMAN